LITVRTVIATGALLDSEDRGGAALASLLCVDAPATWPPEHNDADTRSFFRAMIERNPGEPGYGARYIIAEGRLAGTCGFKGPPDEKGEVEIGYAVVEAEQRRGIATAAVRDLVNFAFADPRVTAVIAETLPGGLPSQKVLSKAHFVTNGFRIDGEEGEIACFRRERPPHPTQ
jgi:[ribosomal protein S5]-alanine N-acetyltransferase